jgi:polar amino acid transport system permease protein
VPHGQVEAGLAQGMNPFMAFRLIVLPQAWRVALPPIGNYGVQLIKDTSLVAAIGAPEIMFTARNLVVNSFETTLVYLLTAALYVAVCMPLILLIQGVERRFAVSR